MEAFSELEEGESAIENNKILSMSKIVKCFESQDDFHFS
jgi:uncharacterized UBP type Zn finger protein